MMKGRILKTTVDNIGATFHPTMEGQTGERSTTKEPTEDPMAVDEVARLSVEDSERNPPVTKSPGATSRKAYQELLKRLKSPENEFYCKYDWLIC